MWQTKARAWAVTMVLAGGAVTGTGYYTHTGFGQTGNPVGKGPAAAGQAERPGPGEGKRYSAKFDKAPWVNVLAWFEKESGLIQVSDVRPTGTVSLSFDNKSLIEVVDLLNEALNEKQFILLRREHTFSVHPADVRLPNDMIPRVTADGLALRGWTEIVLTVLPVKSGTAGDKAEQVRRVLSPFGQVIPFGNNHLMIADKVSVIRQVMALLDELDRANPADAASSDLRTAEARAEVKLAEAELSRAMEEQSYAESMAKKGLLSPAQLESKRLAAEAAAARLEVARRRLNAAQSPPPPALPAQVVDRTTLEFELKMAEAALEGARRLLMLSQEQLESVRKLPTASRFDLANLEAAVAKQQTEADVARLKVDQLRHRITVLDQTAAPDRRPAIEQPKSPEADRQVHELELKMAEARLDGLKGTYAATVEQARFVAQAAKAGGASRAELASIQAKLAQAEAEVRIGEYQVALLRRKMELLDRPAAPDRGGPAPGPARPAAVPPEVRKLREEKLKAARAVLDQLLKQPNPGQAPTHIYSEDVYRWSCRVLDAEADLDPVSRPKAARDHLARMKDLESMRREQVKAGLLRQAEADAVTYYRLEAEEWVKQAEASPRGATDGPGQPRGDQEARPMVPAELRATVTRRDGDLVVITPGLDAGVQKGQVLTVTRFGPAPKYLGTMTVLAADPKTASGRFTPPTGTRPGPDDFPKPGDEVRPR